MTFCIWDKGGACEIFLLVVGVAHARNFDLKCHNISGALSTPETHIKNLSGFLFALFWNLKCLTLLEKGEKAKIEKKRNRDVYNFLSILVLMFNNEQNLFNSTTTLSNKNVALYLKILMVQLLQKWIYFSTVLLWLYLGLIWCKDLNKEGRSFRPCNMSAQPGQTLNGFNWIIDYRQQQKKEEKVNAKQVVCQDERGTLFFQKQYYL